MAGKAGNVKIYLEQGGAKEVIKSGGGFVFQSGSDITMAGGATGIAMSGAYTVTAIQLGTNASPMTLTAYDDHIIDIYSTSGSVDGSNSVRPIYMKSIMTGAGGVGGRAEFHMYTNVALGAWSNAGKFLAEYGAAGRTDGLGSAMCAELQLSAGTNAGAYAPIEGEIIVPTGASTGGNTSFFYLNTSGADASTFDTNGYLFQIGTGITPAAGKFVSADTHTIKCKVEALTRYMVLSQTENGLGIGVSGTPVSFAQGSPPMSLYTTCSSTNGANSVVPFRVESTMTGAGGVGGRSLFYMTTNVALGGWSNALKSEMVYGAAGKTTGLGSSFCSELTMSAGTTSGTYAAIEAEINAPALCATGGSTSFLYVNGTDGSGLLNSSCYLFEIGAAFTSGAANMWYDHQGAAPANIEEWVKWKTPAGDRWMPLYNAVV